MSIANLTRTVLHAEGFTCPACVFTIQRDLYAQRGVQLVTLHFGSALVEIDHDETAIDAERLVQVVADAGFRSAVTAEEPAATSHRG